MKFPFGMIDLEHQNAQQDLQLMEMKKFSTHIYIYHKTEQLGNEKEHGIKLPKSALWLLELSLECSF